MQEIDCQDKEEMQNLCATNGRTEQCCGEHRRRLELFCQEDEAFICVLCVPRHSCHSFVFLHDAVSVYKEHAVNLEKYIAEEFVKLHQFLHDKEQKLIQQLNSKASDILKEMEENLECIKTGVTEIHSAVPDTNLEIKKEVDILEERDDDIDYLATTEESGSGDTSEHGKHKANGVLSEHAVNLEKYIAEEFVKLHQFLHDKEQKLIQQLNSKASEILKEIKENLECIKTGVTEIHSAVPDTNLEIKKEVDILEERDDDTDYLTTTEESVSGDTSEHGKHKANGVLSEHAVNLEKYIAEEFAKLHQFLHDKEQKLIQQLNSKASEILKEMEENLECIKTGVTEIHSAVPDTNLEIKKEVDILEERNDTDYLTTTEESVSGDTSEHGKHNTNGVLSAPESFEDVAVTFSAEEMKMLTKQDKELHKEVMLENYETLVSAGYKIPPEVLLMLLKEDNTELPVNDKEGINRTEHKNNFKEKPDSK
ncbi:uncharacterized protein LOC122813916 isoform X2 [Protopterus annectens]|uniref:uncharacterized protein LOC122813916 isoform X2 n=1 Tax=Protopterus annectens TaxID=7888 RepID=UPI001CF961B9|nr:uncharacterized protein LOC122813916 isoform X2 [Protopterus annectens]